MIEQAYGSNDFDFVIDEVLRVSSVPERSLLRVLASAERLQLDAASLVKSLSAEFRGETAEVLNQLAGALSRGVPVSHALAQSSAVIDPSTVLALQLAESDEARLAMYRQLLANCENDDLAAKKPEDDSGLILLRSMAKLCPTFALLSFVSLFILPAFKTMFDELGLTLPAITLLLFSLAPLLPAIFKIVLVAMAACLVWNAIFSSRSILNRFSSMTWRKRWIAPKTKLLSLLSMVAQSNQSMKVGITLLAQSHSDLKLRGRLQEAMARMERGEAMFDALASARLLTGREANALSFTSTRSAQAWLFRWFATKRWHRSRMRSSLVAKSIATLATLSLGFVVAWTAFGVIIPLFDIITALT